MFKISMTTFPASVFKTSGFKVSYQFSDFPWHTLIVPLRYHYVKTANDGVKKVPRIQKVSDSGVQKPLP